MKSTSTDYISHPIIRRSFVTVGSNYSVKTRLQIK